MEFICGCNATDFLPSILFELEVYYQLRFLFYVSSSYECWSYLFCSHKISLAINVLIFYTLFVLFIWISIKINMKKKQLNIIEYGIVDAMNLSRTTEMWIWLLVRSTNKRRQSILYSILSNDFWLTADTTTQVRMTRSHLQRHLWFGHSHWRLQCDRLLVIFAFTSLVNAKNI